MRTKLRGWWGVLLLPLLLLGCKNIDKAQEYRELQAQLSEESQTIWEVLPLAVDEVERVVVRSEGLSVEVIRLDSGQWISGEGAVQVTPSLMFDVERVLFPLLSYRKLAVDGSDPAFGLTAGGLAATVETKSLGSWHVRFGTQTFSGGGHYAQLDHDPNVYTVIPPVVDGLQSVLLGEKVFRGVDPRFASALNELMLVTTAEEDLNPWLAQVLEHEDQ